MLVLTRKVDEKLYIGKDREIEIVIVEVRGDRVRIGIKAPQDIPILRDELAARIDAEAAEAAAVNS